MAIQDLVATPQTPKFALLLLVDPPLEETASYKRELVSADRTRGKSWFFTFFFTIF